MTDDIIEGTIIRVEETPRDLSTDLRRWAVAAVALAVLWRRVRRPNFH